MKLLRETDQYEVLQGGSLAVGGILKGIPEYPLGVDFIPLYAGGQIGIVPSTCGEKITWIKPKGMNLYVADRCLLVCVSRDDLVASGFDGTSSVIEIDGEKYISRILKVGDVLNKVPNEWDDFLDAIGTEDDALIHWKGVYFWGQDEVETMAGRYVLRGGREARYAAQGKSNYKDVHIGFRPVLVRLGDPMRWPWKRQNDCNCRKFKGGKTNYGNERDKRPHPQCWRQSPHEHPCHWGWRSGRH